MGVLPTSGNTPGQTVLRAALVVCEKRFMVEQGHNSELAAKGKVGRGQEESGRDEAAWASQSDAGTMYGGSRAASERSYASTVRSGKGKAKEGKGKGKGKGKGERMGKGEGGVALELEVDRLKNEVAFLKGQAKLAET